MGTICEGVNQEGSHHIRNSSKQTPHPYYAVPTNLTISPPVSNEYIANILNHQRIHFVTKPFKFLHGTTPASVLLLSLTI